MPSITLKAIPEELHAQLKHEASQEALATGPVANIVSG
jgi:hypothetical protein